MQSTVEQYFRKHIPQLSGMSQSQIYDVYNSDIIQGDIEIYANPKYKFVYFAENLK